MNKWISELNRQLCKGLSERGQGMIEYALIIAVIAVISVGVFVGSGGGGHHFGDSVNEIYQQTGNSINQIEVTSND